MEEAPDTRTAWGIAWGGEIHFVNSLCNTSSFTGNSRFHLTDLESSTLGEKNPHVQTITARKLFKKKKKSQCSLMSVQLPKKSAVREQ